MKQTLVVRMILLQALIMYCCDVYIIFSNNPFPTKPSNLLVTSNELVEGLLIVLFFRLIMYFLLVSQSKKTGKANIVLLIGSFIITAAGFSIELDPTNNHGWEFLSFPIQFVGLLILWPLVALTHRSSGTGLQPVP